MSSNKTIVKKEEYAILHTSNPVQKMQTTYHEWRCVGCLDIVRFIGGQNILSPMPYWFTVRTERRVSSGSKPSFDISVCSIACFEKVGVVISDLIESRPHSIPHKQHIDATFCNQCGKMEKFDRLNMIFGPVSSQDWIQHVTSADRKDFCSDGCRRDHSVRPEDSVFSNSILMILWRWVV